MPFTDSIKMVDVVIAEENLITASPSDVASGKSYIGTTKNLETGTIPVIEPHSDIILDAGQSHIVPYGINKVSYLVKGRDLRDQTVATAEPSHILVRKTAWVNGTLITGEIPEHEDDTINLNAGQSYTIPMGYHKGGSVITGNTLSSQTYSSCAPGDIKVGSNAWVNGEYVEGTMPNRGSVNKILFAGQSFNIEEGYHNGTGTISAVNLSSQTSGTAIAEQIVEGNIAWVNGEQVIGTMPNNIAETIVLPTNGEYVIPQGYHTGLGVVTQNVPSKPGPVIGPTKDPQTIEVAGYYMESDITVTGVDALNYQRPNTTVKDSTGADITMYELTVASNVSTVLIEVDNWHDNATMNLYKIAFTDLITASGASMNLDCLIAIDWKDHDVKTYTFGEVSISIDLQEGTNSHRLTINNITSGKITITELFSSREFGVITE